MLCGSLFPGVFLCLRFPFIPQIANEQPQVSSEHPRRFPENRKALIRDETVRRSANKPGSRTLSFIDRHLGIPVLMLLRIFHRRQVLPLRIKRIALLKGSGMGDIALLSGPLRDLREAFPEAVISLWGSDNVVPIARELALLSEVHPVDFRCLWRAIHQLRRWQADVVIDCGQWTRAEALLCGLSGARFRIGFATPRQYRKALFDASVPHRCDCHELENFRQLLCPLEIDACSQPRIEPRGQPQDERIPTGPYVVFHMWPSGDYAELKEWPGQQWGELARACRQQNLHVVLTGGKHDMEPTSRWIRQFNITNGIEDRTGVSLAETLSILEGAKAVVSVNTGIMHVAAALGRPTIGLHGPTNAKRWGPIGQVTATLEVPPPAGGYLNLGFEYPADARSRSGTETIRVEDVLAVLKELTSS